MIPLCRLPAAVGQAVSIFVTAIAWFRFTRYSGRDVQESGTERFTNLGAIATLE